MSDNFTIRVSSADASVGLLNATGEDEFGDNNICDTTYTTYYELAYVIDQDDDVVGGSLTVLIFDRVGNNRTLSLTCTKDNISPTSGTITSVQVGLSYYLYYSGTIFYYNNQNPMNDPFTVNITASDASSGLRSTNGSFDFNEQQSSLDYTQGHFSLVYIVSAGELASDNEVQFLLYDYVGNSAPVTLTFNLDNDKPTLVTITDMIGSTSSEYLHYSAGVLYFVRGTDVTPVAGDVEGWHTFVSGTSGDSYHSIYGGEGNCDHIAMYADKHVEKVPELIPTLKIIKQKLRVEYEKGEFPWKPEYDKV